MRVPARVLALLFAAVLVSCTSVPPVIAPTPVPTREPGAVLVSVLLDLSGPRAPGGQPQRNAMQIWIDQNAARAVKLRVKFVDVAGSDAKLLLEFRRAAIDDRADAIVVGVPTSLDDPMMQAAQVAGIPILLTLPLAEPALANGGRFAFALAPTPESLAHALAGDIVDRGLLAPTLLAGDESHAAVIERAAYLAELRRRALLVPMPVSLASPDSAQRVRAAATVARSIVLAGASAPYGDLIRGVPVTVDAPRVYLSYLTETADVTNLRDQAGLVTWPGSKRVASLSSPAPAAAAAFIKAFGDRYGPPSTLAATAFDALALIDHAASAAPSEIDAARLRLRLETSTFEGVATSYTFTPARHVGFATADLAYLRWDAQRGAPFPAPTAKQVDR
jgi:ABC-type branched-subunit amino acid transport system substrate-binding protein